MRNMLVAMCVFFEQRFQVRIRREGFDLRVIATVVWVFRLRGQVFVLEF